MAAEEQQLADSLVLGTWKGGTTCLQQLLEHHPESWVHPDAVANYENVRLH